MTKTLVLYTGSFEAGDFAHERLLLWSKSQPDIEVTRRSVHDDPAAVVRLGITNVPALILNNEVLAQGSPDLWLTDEFLQTLAIRVRH